MGQVITIPYKPRNWASELHDSIKRWILMVLHRRAGKTTAVLNHLQRDCVRIPNSQFAYIGPCYDEKTEILTDNGWKYFKDLKNEKVSTYDKGELKFVKPQEKFIYPYNGEMVGYKGRLLDFLITPNHRCLVKLEDKKEWIIRRADEIYGKTRIGFKRNIERWVGKKNNQVFFEFLGFWFAEGYARIRTHQPKDKREKLKNKKGKEWRERGEIVLTQKKFIEYTEKLITDNGFDIHKSVGVNANHYYIYNTKLAKKLVQYGKSNDKFIPKWIKNADRECLTAFLKGYWMGDGHFPKDYSETKRAITKSKQLADDIQELIIKTGGVSNVSQPNGFWLISWLNAKYQNPQSSKKGWYKTDYKGNVYCVKVPSGIVMVRRNGKHFLCGNTYKQTKRIAWDFIKKYSRDIPGVRYNEVELTVKYPNSSKLFLAGSEDIDALRGITLWGAALDEWPLQPPNLFSEVISKCLADHLGYCIFFGTPKGKNHFYRAYKNALNNPEDWTVIFKTIDDSLREEEGETIENLRIALEDDKRLMAQGEMTQEEFNQEWYCSFEAALKGAYYGEQLSEARKNGRIKVLPYDKNLLVHTVWDLGVGPALAIGFYQKVSNEVHKIDYWEGKGDEGIAEGIKVVKDKPYIYGLHFAPHDIKAKEEMTGKTRIETAESLGIKFKVVPRLSVIDGIDAGRMMFSRLWIDSRHCEAWLDTIGQYHREWDDEKKDFKKTPYSDWTNHAADEYRYAAVVENEMVNEIIQGMDRRRIISNREQKTKRKQDFGI